MYQFKDKNESIKNMQLHVLYCLLYGCSIIAGICQPEQKIYTFILLTLLIPITLIPFFKYLRNKSTRYTMQLLFPILAGIWLIYRVMTHITSDKFMIETLAIAGLAFAFTIHKNDRMYFILISSIIIIYGAVFPRATYIYLLPFIIILFFLIFYLSRTEALTNNSNNNYNSSSLRKSNFSFLYIIPQTALIILITIYLYILMPDKDITSKGYFTVSFENNNINLSPSIIQNWFTSEKVYKTKDGIRKIAGKNGTLSKKSKQKVKANKNEKSMSSKGSGNGAPSNDLLFTVKSDDKLYWLANIYDLYNGKTWKTSKKMKKQRIRHTTDFFQTHITVSQKFTIHKWITRTLPSAFSPSYYSLKNKKTTIVKTLFNSKLKIDSQYPPLPFIYITSIFLPSQNSTKSYNKKSWWEKIKKQHYIKLPKDKITLRLKQKAKEITIKAKSDYEKAMAIRNFLRKNFKYKQFSEKAPDGKETVDYFIFNLKEGHCEYFAAAMVVLARLNNLPARVATGFSSGNYNIITKSFEVHEYHAHAWGQIFIDGIDWLTFDATPPGEIISKTYPLGIGALKDPFGDEWEIAPPELAKSVQEKSIRKEPSNKKDDNIISNLLKTNNSKLHNLILKIPENNEELNKSFNKLKHRIKKREPFFSKYYKRFKANFKTLIKSILTIWKNTINFFNGINGIIALFIIILFFPVSIMVKHIFYKTKLLINRRKCNYMLKKAMKNVQISPKKSIEASYASTRNLLEILGYGNSKNLDLFDYALSLKKINKELSNNLLQLVSIYTKMIYSKEQVTIFESEQALEKTINIISIIKYLSNNKS